MTQPQYVYAYPHPAVTTDIVIFSIREGRLHVLLIERKGEPFVGHWAIPGGFIKMDESLEDGALRELMEETGLKRDDLPAHDPLRQFYTYGDVGRDPRERVITVAYMALIRSDRVVLEAASDASDARWFAMDDLPAKLAFDHDKILARARAELGKLVMPEVSSSADVAFRFLPEKFTLAEAQEVFETIYGKPIDKRNFRKWINATWDLVDTKEQRTGGRHRPAALYSYEEPGPAKA